MENNGIVTVPLYASLELLSILFLRDNPLRFPPQSVVNSGPKAVVAFFKAKQEVEKIKRRKIAFLMGFHPRLGIHSAINLFLYRSSIYEPALLQMIFEL